MVDEQVSVLLYLGFLVFGAQFGRDGLHSVVSSDLIKRASNHVSLHRKSSARGGREQLWLQRLSAKSPPSLCDSACRPRLSRVKVGPQGLREVSIICSLLLGPYTFSRLAFFADFGFQVDDFASAASLDERLTSLLSTPFPSFAFFFSFLRLFLSFSSRASSVKAGASSRSRFGFGSGVGVGVAGWSSSPTSPSWSSASSRATISPNLTPKFVNCPAMEARFVRHHRRSVSGSICSWTRRSMMERFRDVLMLLNLV